MERGSLKDLPTTKTLEKGVTLHNRLIMPSLLLEAMEMTLLHHIKSLEEGEQSQNPILD